MNDHSDNEDTNGDGEGVWSPDIEQCFREALLLFPPCGRRKHILQEEGGGKMYGRNELIARHIRMRTGKIRSRKQVSSHIQVLARRKAKAETGSSSDLAAPSSVSPLSSIGVPQGTLNSMNLQQPLNNDCYDDWADRPIVTNKIRLVEFSAFIERRWLTPTSNDFTRHSYVKIDYREPVYRRTAKLEPIAVSQIHDKFPEMGGSEGLYQRGPADAFYLVKFWADLNNDFDFNIDDQNSYFGFSCHYETIDPLNDITCSTKACSYGSQVVEKVEKIYGTFNNSNSRYSYDIDRSPMCEFMIQFIKKLRQLTRASQMNSVLENFTVLQVITNEATSEILLCLAFVFEIASAGQLDGSQYHVYKLTKD